MVLPEGVAIATSIGSILGLYGLIRNGIEAAYQDVQHIKTIEMDIKIIIEDLAAHETALAAWKTIEWHISEKTPDEFLVQLWGEDAFKAIKFRLKLMDTVLAMTRKKLGPLWQSEQEEPGLQSFSGIKKFNRRRHALALIYTKRNYIQTNLVDGWKHHYEVIKTSAQNGWQLRQRALAPNTGHITPLDYQLSYLLVRISIQNRTDAEVLRKCCQASQHEVSTYLDLGMFKEGVDQELIHQISSMLHVHVGSGDMCLKVELLLHEANGDGTQMVRLLVEKTDIKTPRSLQPSIGFKSMLSSNDKPFIIAGPPAEPDPPALFQLTRLAYSDRQCPHLQRTFRELLATRDSPVFDHQNRYLENDTVLGRISRARVAFELAQTCLLFMGTKCVGDLCRCCLRCGTRDSRNCQVRYHFGIEFKTIDHQPPLFPNVTDRVNPILGTSEHSWCMVDFHWDLIHKPIRHLGLLLFECLLGTIVFPITVDRSDGAAPVQAVQICETCAPSGDGRWELFPLDKALRVIKRNVGDSDLVARAIECCLTISIDRFIPEKVWQEQLERFYLVVVRPLRQFYIDVLATAGL